MNMQPFPPPRQQFQSVCPASCPLGRSMHQAACWQLLSRGSEEGPKAILLVSFHFPRPHSWPARKPRGMSEEGPKVLSAADLPGASDCAETVGRTRAGTLQTNYAVCAEAGGHRQA